MSEQWYRIFNNNFCIPHVKKRSTSTIKQSKSWTSEPRPYVVQISSLHWQDVGDQPVQLHLHLYDSNFKKFFGRSCALPWMKNFNANELNLYSYGLIGHDETEPLFLRLCKVTMHLKKQSLEVSNIWLQLDGQTSNFSHNLGHDSSLIFEFAFPGQAVYFHLSNDEHILLIFELATRNACIGWTFAQLTDLRTISTQNRIQMFKGNPAIVRKLLKKPEDISHIPKSGATIQFSYKLHNELIKIIHLLPENTIIHEREIIPGLMSETHLANPRAEEEIRCSLTDVVCKLGSMGRRIDAELCDLLNKERVLKENVPPNGEHLVILEKRLKIGIHNGWTYTKEPCLYYLMPRDKLGSRHSDSLLKLDSSATASMLKNVAFETLPRISGMDDLVLINLVEFSFAAHPAIVLVFYLEYILGLQSAKPNPPAQVVTVAWAVWSPFESLVTQHQDQRRVNLVLKGGPSKNPDHVLCFHDLYSLSPTVESANDSGLQIQLEFVFKSNVPKTVPLDTLVAPEQKNIQPKQPPTDKIDETIVDVHDPHERIPAKIGHDGVKPSDDHSKLIDIPQQPKLKEITSEIHPKIINDDKPLLKPIPMPRQIAILLADKKFDKILDRNDQEPLLVDFSRENKFDLESDFNDPLLCNEIIFYFQAIEMFEGVQVPDEIFLTLHFYKFPEICTERLLTSALSEESDTGIFLLKHLDKLGRIVEDSSGFKVKFILDVNNMPPDTYHEAIRYLYNHVLCIEIWNSQSMMLFGKASLPLRELCRRGKEAVSGYCNLPVLSDNLEKANIDATMTATSQANTDVLGFLYIQAANVGYPSSGGLDTLLLDYDEEKMSSNKGGLVRVLKSKRLNAVEGENLCYKVIANRSHSLIARCNDLRPMLITAKRLTGLDLDSLTEDKRRRLARLEYVRQNIENIDSGQPNPPAQVVTVAWAVWSPFESLVTQHQDQRRVNLVLKGGPSKNPDHVLCFHDLYSLSPTVESANDSGLQIQLEFVFKSNVPKTVPLDTLVAPEQKNIQPKQPPTDKIDETIVDVHDPHERIPAKIGHDGVKPSDDHSKLIDIPQQPKLKEITSEIHPKIINDDKPLLKPIPMPRQIAILLADKKFDKILDRNDQEPLLVDFSRENKFDLESDFNDPLLCNEIIFYFQAIEMFEGVQVPDEIFLTLHFYKFPEICTERLLTSALSEESDTGIFLLKHLDKLGRIVEDSSGFKVKFILDVNNMPPDTYHEAIRYLYNHVLCIEIWNSQSMMLFGKASLPLRELCRRGKEAVSGYCNLPVLSDNLEKANIDATMTATSQANTDVLGFLYIQAANVGYPSSGGLDTLLLDYDEEKMSSNKGGLVRVLKSKRLNAVEGENLCYKVIANRSHSLIARCNDLRPMLITAKRLTGLDLDSLTEDKRRRLARLEYVRQNIENIDSGQADKLSLQDYDRDLETIQQYKNSLKDQQIMAHIRKSMSIFYTIYPTMGNNEFFEFQITNPYNAPCRVKIVITERNLRIIKDTKEWKFYRSVYNLKTPMDLTIFVDKSQKSGKEEDIVLKPSESSYIPFKYESPLIDLQKFRAQMTLDSRIKSLQEINRMIDVKFFTRRNDDEDQLLQNLTVYIEPQMPVFDRFYRFFHTECTSVCKILRFNVENLSTMHKDFMRKVSNSFLSVKVTDPTVVVDVSRLSNSSQCDLHMKTTLFTSPAVKSFQILFYVDQYFSRAVAVWHVCLHAVQSMELSLTQGQPVKLALHGRKDLVDHSRMIKCYHSANLEDVSFLREQPVLVQAGQHADVDLLLRSLQQGKRTIQFSMVDVELNQILQMWHVHLEVGRPTITKTFKVDLPKISGPTDDHSYISKKIPYINKYDVPRLFKTSVDCPKLVRISDPVLNLEPKGAGTINLLFTSTPPKNAAAMDVLVFVINQDGTLEDTFSLQITYQ